jgi:hypothetical protein
MPERWEREVGKLGMLTAPPSVPPRIGEGPHDDGMPPPPRRGQRIAAGIVAFAVFGGAAALAAGVFRSAAPVAPASPAPSSSSLPPPSNAANLIARLEAPADGSMPRLSLTYDDHTTRFDARDGRWPGVTLSPSPLREFDPPIDPGANLVVHGDTKTVEGTLWISDADQNLTGQSIPLDVSSGSATLPEEPGFYRLTLAGTWPQGEAGFSVGITIGTPPADWPPPPGTALVPDVIGLDKHEAVARLIDAGFEMASVANPAGEASGVVTSQDPPPGTRIDTTTVIRLTVSPSS